MPVLPPPFNAADLDILARTIFGEARGEGWQGQIAVAWVVVNRVARPKRFGSSVAGVCLAPLQFSCWNRNDPTFFPMMVAALGDPRFVKAMAAAGAVLTNSQEDPTSGADHYHTAAVSPSWSRDPMRMRKTIQIGAHIFFKEVL